MLLRTAKFVAFLAVVLSLTSVAYAGPIFFGVTPTDTYLRTSPGDSPTSPLFINLTTLGAAPGSSIILQSVGGLCFMAGTGSCGQTELIASFTSDTSLASQTTLNRLAAIGPPIGIISVVTAATWPSGDPTDIAQDFQVPFSSTITVVVPDGATYLAVGLNDSWLADNHTWSGDALGINAEVAAIPEPGTILMLASGLGLLVVLRRKLRA